MSNDRSLPRFTYKDIRSLLPASHGFVGVEEFIFDKLRTPATADNCSLVFIGAEQNEKQEMAEKTAAAVVICDEKIAINGSMSSERAFIIVKDPRGVFSKVGNSLFRKKHTPGVHPTAFVHPLAQIDPSVYIGPLCSIGRATIGAGTVLYGNNFIYDDVFIGEHVMINAGTVIGAEGFGYLKNALGEYENFPHVGRVVIEDFVEIGANTCIDRGALWETRIKRGVKIDNLVHIAHNVVIEPNALIIADAMIGGSTHIGAGAWVSPSCAIRDQLRIGPNARVGMGAVVTKDVPENETWAGSPARPIDDFIRLQKRVKGLIAEGDPD